MDDFYAPARVYGGRYAWFCTARMDQGSKLHQFQCSLPNQTKRTTATTHHKSTHLNPSNTRKHASTVSALHCTSTVQAHKLGTASLGSMPLRPLHPRRHAAVETTGLAGNINRHSNPPACPATPMRWRQSTLRNTPI